jgi:hypothetical protein
MASINPLRGSKANPIRSENFTRISKFIRL